MTKKKKVQVGVWSLTLSVLEMDKEQICQYIFMNIYTCTYEQNIVLCCEVIRARLRLFSLPGHQLYGLRSVPLVTDHFDKDKMELKLFS